MDDEFERRRPITAAQWAGARALSEGAPPTRRRVAILLGCDDSAVYAHAAAEGWKTLDFRSRDVADAYRDFMELAAARRDGDGPGAGPPGPGAEGDIGPEPAGEAEAAGECVDPADGSDDPVAMLARGARFMSRRLGVLMARAERGGRLHKAEIDNLAAMARMMERWETLAKERAREDEARSDEELAEAYREIDRRIVALAREEAQRLVEAGYRSDDRRARA